MKNKYNSLVIIIEFFIILIGILIFTYLKKDDLVSISERRKLLQMPKLSLSTFSDGSFQKNFEGYLQDQIVFREYFKNINFKLKNNVFKNKDINEYFIKNNMIFKLGKTNKNNIDKTISNLNKIIDLYMKDNRIYVSIIPDKNYYLDDDSYLSIDEAYIENKIKTDMKATYIDIKDKIELNDFYNTDLHLKQECTISLVSTICNTLNNNTIDISNYEERILGDFEGAYYYNVPEKLPKDTLKILTNKTLDNIKVYNYEKNKYEAIYNLDYFEYSIDKYDIFLSGPNAIQKIENPNVKNDNKLIIFRDSFGSEIVPLMVDMYSEIIVIDLRYISPKILKEYVNFENKDILFIYSIDVLNQNILKSLE